VVSEFGLVKVPVPLDVQATLVWLVALDPAVIFTGPELEHVTIAAPATAVGRAVIVKGGDAPAPEVLKGGLVERNKILNPDPVGLVAGIVTVCVIPVVTPPLFPA
jgi:hypothetical protein